jgi:hypothetical protein
VTFETMRLPSNEVISSKANEIVQISAAAVDGSTLADGRLSVRAESAVQLRDAVADFGAEKRSAGIEIDTLAGQPKA